MAVTLYNCLCLRVRFYVIMHSFAHLFSVRKRLLGYIFLKLLLDNLLKLFHVVSLF